MVLMYSDPAATEAMSASDRADDPLGMAGA
jgi:hypothetical protein